MEEYLKQIFKHMHNQSDNINELATALCKAQGEFETAKKDSKNPYFNSKYASLSSLWESCREVLVKNNLSIAQTLGIGEYGSFLSTMLLHTSGQWLRGEQHLNPVKDDPQGIGSAITYARRYGLSAILGIVSDEDDDGNAAAGNKTEYSSKQPTAKPPSTAASTESQPENKELSRNDDLNAIKEKSGRLGSEGAKKTLASRMQASGKYSKEEILYATGVSV